jgi:organic hydroperoxide reductase OsmC/OhrA
MGDEFEVRVAWPADASQKLPPDPAFSRNNRLAAPGKVEIPGSAPVVFGGDPQGYNPEELLLLSLSECHMLTYLAIAAKRGVVVLQYEDRATGVLGKGGQGKTQMTQAVLHPRVFVRKGTNLDEARAMHEKAHASCFIANSVNFPVRNEPEVVER